MRIEIEVSAREYAKLKALGSEMNDRTPEQVAYGIVGYFLAQASKPGRPRSDSSCTAAMRLAYKLWKERGKTFSFESLAKAYKNQWPVHAIRSRLSTMRAAGELNYRRVSKGVFEFTDV